MVRRRERTRRGSAIHPGRHAFASTWPGMIKPIFSICAFGLLALCPSEAGAIGVMYMGVGGQRADLMQFTSADISVTIGDRVAVTRMDQVFTNLSDAQVEGIYEFTLPEGAIITDLVLWIGDKRIQGLILEKEEARRTYDDIVGRRIDPALVEHVHDRLFRLSVFPFPPNGSRRVELEYAQVLEARVGRTRYSFPTAQEQERSATIGTLTLNIAVEAQHDFDLAIDDHFSQATTVERADEASAVVTFADEEVDGEHDFTLDLIEVEEQRRPTVLSYAPDGEEMGYYALWLPPLRELLEHPPLPRTLTFVVDISSSMDGGKLEAVKQALATALGTLTPADEFNVVVFGSFAEAFSESPVPATADNIEDAIAFVLIQGALGATDYEAALRAALASPPPPGRINHVIFLTDGNPTLGLQGLPELGELVQELGSGQIRLFSIGIGLDVNRGFLRSLAEDNAGEAAFVDDGDSMADELVVLFEEFSKPLFVAPTLELDGVDVRELIPTSIEHLAVGEEVFQVGRYTAGGSLTFRLRGWVQDEEVVIEYPIALAETDKSRAIIPRLWAHRKVQSLDEQIDRFGENAELLADILNLGLEYRLVTRRTSLFAPDPEVAVNPEPEEEFVDAPTAVEEETTVLEWLGKRFYLRDGVWVDVAYRPGMPLTTYEATPGQPPALASFAALDRDMIVVLDAYDAFRIHAGTLPVAPVLEQNWPNPFNAATAIQYHIPPGLQAETVTLTVFNSGGQEVMSWVFSADPRNNRVLWNGQDSDGNAVASGVYILNLRAGPHTLSRHMTLLR